MMDKRHKFEIKLLKKNLKEHKKMLILLMIY